MLWDTEEREKDCRVEEDGLLFKQIAERTFREGGPYSVKDPRVVGAILVVPA